MPRARAKQLIFWTLMLVIPVVAVGAGLYVFRPILQRRLEPQIIAHLTANLSQEDRATIVQKIAENNSGLWDVVSEADVGRISRRNVTAIENQTEVRTNNAGMRSQRPYRRKAKGVFRIACLGDSMVFGSGGLEQDRFCDQLEDFYRRSGITVGDASIEAYAIGISSWTMLQETTYLASRISAYDPDLILLLSIGNDITDSYGVTGNGSTTRAFSPEHRSWGSAFFSNKTGSEFTNPKCCSALQWDLSPESRQRWDKAMARLERLIDLQHRRGKHILLSILDNEQRGGRYSHFTELLNFHLKRSGIEEPLLVVSYPINEPGISLPHDPSHPTRLGHEVLRNQYIHAFNRLGWIPVAADKLPQSPPDLAGNLEANPDPKALAALRDAYVERHVPSEIDFAHFDPRWTHALLGGVFPERNDKPLDHPLWASVRAGFLLRRQPGFDAEELEIRISAPPLLELFPLQIDLYLNGQRARRFNFAEPHPSGTYTLSVRAPPRSDDHPLLEVVLETSSYFVHFNNGRMRSYQLLSARLL